MRPPRGSIPVSLLIIAALSAVLLHRYSASRAGAAAAPEKRKPAAAATGAKSAAIKDIPYTKPADAKNARRQTLDLYMPAKRAAKPPLVVFIHGGFWTLSDDEFGIGPAFAEGLLPSGVAVAVVRYRLAPAAKHPAQAEDVAAAIAYLARAAEKHGYDPKRIYLAGHSAGAHLAALVALDPKYLAAHGLSPQALAGVIGFSGIYDLAFRPETIGNQRFAVEQAFGANPAALKAASPAAHARAGAPPFLLFTADGDFPGYIADAKQFCDALARAGNKQIERFVVPERDHFSLVRVDDPSSESRSLMLEFMKVEPLPADMAELIAAKRRWREPPFSTLPFWSEQNKKFIETHPVDARLVAELAIVYASVRYELLEWPLEKFSAVDLFAYVDAQPEKFGRGNYLTITNFRGEKIFWNRREMARYKPTVVVGLDGEKNLFRLAVFYQARREYSWRDTPRPPIMARPIGGFIHFIEEPPEDVARQGPFYGLTDASFKLTEEDPLAPLRDLPKEILITLTTRNGCVYCHSFRGAGAESRHYGATDAKLHGGIALALESYPDAVWRRFVFNPNEAAKLIGASPNPIAEESRQALYDLVVAARRARK